MNSVSASVYADSNVGNIRTKNEDNYYLNGATSDSSGGTHIEKTNRFICAVCDGMGGEFAGEVASEIAVNTIAEYAALIEKSDYSDSSITDALMHANSKICEEIRNVGRDMGTTVAMLCFNNGKIVCSNIGDSRIYKLTNGIFNRISKDHTKEQLLIDAGLSVASENDKHILTQHLGIAPENMLIEPYIFTDTAQSGDIYLLCSDGLYDMVGENMISLILQSEFPDKIKVDSLIQEALNNGGHDNVTVMLIHCF